MSEGNTVQQDLVDSVDGQILDPGDAGTITSLVGLGVCALVTGGAETRTVSDPVNINQKLRLCLDTDGGDCVATFDSDFDQSGNNVVTFDDAGDSVHFEAITIAGSPKWRITANVGAALS